MDVDLCSKVLIEIQSFGPSAICFQCRIHSNTLKEAGIHQPVDFKKGKLPVGCSKKLEEAFPPKNQQLRVPIVQVVQSPLSQQNNNEVVVYCLFELKHT